jgi:hypothetical protein
MSMDEHYQYTYEWIPYYEDVILALSCHYTNEGPVEFIAFVITYRILSYNAKHKE